MTYINAMSQAIKVDIDLLEFLKLKKKNQQHESYIIYIFRFSEFLITRLFVTVVLL